jgi:hypothetical protein
MSPISQPHWQVKTTQLISTKTKRCIARHTNYRTSEQQIRTCISHSHTSVAKPMQLTSTKNKCWTHFPKTKAGQDIPIFRQQKQACTGHNHASAAKPLQLISARTKNYIHDSETRIKSNTSQCPNNEWKLAQVTATQARGKPLQLICTELIRTSTTLKQQSEQRHPISKQQMWTTQVTATKAWQMHATILYQNCALCLRLWNYDQRNISRFPNTELCKLQAHKRSNTRAANFYENLALRPWLQNYDPISKSQFPNNKPQTFIDWIE